MPVYGKIFESMYDGTLVEDWRALITFQQMIILASPDGVVDMTPRTMARRTGIPIEHIEAGLKILANPDPYSRTPGEEGRRIVLIDGHREWGWQIVNHEKYKKFRTAKDRRQYMREYMRDHRERTTLEPCGYCGKETRGVDHIIPKADGGSDDESNLVKCCQSCNKSKKHYSLPDWFFAKNKVKSNMSIKLSLKNQNIRRIFEDQAKDVNDVNLRKQCKTVLTQLTNTDTDTDTYSDTDTVKKGRFTPPTLEEVSRYCNERKNNVDPQHFIDHYEANGWIRGKTKIKDWKACVRTWEQQRGNNSAKPKHDGKTALERFEESLGGSVEGGEPDIR